MRHADEPELSEQDKRAIEAIRLELDREFGPPWPDAAPPAGGELAPPARSAIVTPTRARPSKGLRLALGAGITTLAAAVVAAVVTLVDVGALIAPPRSASLHRSASATRPAPPPLSEPNIATLPPAAVPSQPAAERDPGDSPRLTHRTRPVSRAGDAGDSGRPTGAPSYRRPVASQPVREGSTLTTRYRTERAHQSPAQTAERVNYVQAP